MTQEPYSHGYTAVNPVPICRTSEEEKRVSIIKAPHYSGIGPVDESGIPIAVRTTVDRPKDWYKTMFKQIHMVHKPDDTDGDTYNATYAFVNTDNYSPSNPMQAHPAPKTYTYRPLSKSISDNSSSTFKDSSPLLPPPPPPMPSLSQLRPPERATPEMNEWGPPDRKVDTRKYRAEPRSIFEYEPGKSSILQHERPCCLAFHIAFILVFKRNEWGPPDRKVDTRKYRAEPRSIFEYEPGKSSILQHERPIYGIHADEIDLENEPWYKFFSELEFGRPAFASPGMSPPLSSSPSNLPFISSLSPQLPVLVQDNLHSGGEPRLITAGKATMISLSGSASQSQIPSEETGFFRLGGCGSSLRLLPLLPWRGLVRCYVPDLTNREAPLLTLQAGHHMWQAGLAVVRCDDVTDKEVQKPNNGWVGEAECNCIQHI
ncbi:UNVERIFIED_CONTAM: hypothetical protein FKN15_058713 [Acipenser sinensis]